MRILVAENNPAVLGLLDDNLTQWGYEVVVCGDGPEAWRILQEKEPPSLALLEWELPEMSGPEICRRFRELAYKPYVYIILLTNDRSKEAILEGLEAGADEYIVKPIDTRELQVRLRTGNRIMSLQKTFISVLKLSEHEAAHDSLTGLWNRPAIADLLVKELSRSRRDRSQVGVIATGLDQSRRLAEDFGELTRDSILREVVLRIHSTVRSYDLVGRLQDEDFLIVAPGCDEETSRTLAQRLGSSVRRFKASVGNQVVPLTMSCGVVSGDGAKHRHAESLIEAAQEALRTARAKGGGVVEVGE